MSDDYRISIFIYGKFRYYTGFKALWYDFTKKELLREGYYLSFLKNGVVIL